jgi:hypothetical protein
VCVFAALGFVDLLEGVAKGENYFWSYVRRLVTGNYSCTTADMVLPVLMFAGMLAVPAAILGWAVQAVLVVLLSPRQGRNRTAGELGFCRGAAPDGSQG